MLADDVATGRAEDVADEENVHLLSLSRVGEKSFSAEGAKEGARVAEEEVDFVDD